MNLDFIKKHPLIAFIVLSYIFSWSTWIIAAVGETPSTFLTWIGGFGPAIAAITLTAVLEGRIGLTRLLSKVFVWKFNPLLYLAAIGLPVIGTVAIDSSLFADKQRSYTATVPGILAWDPGKE